ncbi:transcriptional regulator BolA [Thaumasiovibrio subtropicus]|uniref:transcriptional regulator BolA n=1 Tax=Thaumasiovibrio subtropicus TaxID=1891207 RepID=UPI000B35FBF5|nr:transcriptional regulator BolA [Thaumasiovibrio subtropicus]
MIKETIEQKLLDAFTPSHLEVVNESYMHNVPAGAESHFKVVVVSDEFDGQRLLQRHRAINTILATELSDHIHALAIHTYTGNEWQNLYQGAPNSPSCRGGAKLTET